MKRIIRDRPLTPDEIAEYNAVREQVAAELPELFAQRFARLETRARLERVLKELKAAREAKGLTLAEIGSRTGMEAATVSELEGGELDPERRVNPTVETLVRYAEAVGKRLVFTLDDASAVNS